MEIKYSCYGFYLPINTFVYVSLDLVASDTDGCLSGRIHQVQKLPSKAEAVLPGYVSGVLRMSTCVDKDITGYIHCTIKDIHSGKTKQARMEGSLLFITIVKLKVTNPNLIFQVDQLLQFSGSIISNQTPVTVLVVHSYLDCSYQVPKPSPVKINPKRNVSDFLKLAENAEKIPSYDFLASENINDEGEIKRKKTTRSNTTIPKEE